MFLAGPRQGVGRFAYSKSIRDHLSQRIGTSLHTWTDRDKGWTYTLVVEKRENEGTVINAWKDYNDRKDHAMNAIRSLDLEYLGHFLGRLPAWLIDIRAPVNSQVVEQQHTGSPTANVLQPIAVNVANRPTVQIIDLAAEETPPPTVNINTDKQDADEINARG